ncbi:unnamed protein product, partial [Symbiodinium necroappetens]
GPVLDFGVDKNFIYSLGEDLNIRIWSLSDLKQVVLIPADHIQASALTGQEGQAIPLMLPSLKETPRESPRGASQSHDPTCLQLSALTALKRPLSRWAGAQASARSNAQTVPRGALFVAGVMAQGQSAAAENAGILMDCRDMSGASIHHQYASDLPIVTMAYGPCDNGPLITADMRGLCRIWDCTPRLRCSQQIEAAYLGRWWEPGRWGSFNWSRQAHVLQPVLAQQSRKHGLQQNLSGT